MAMLIRGGHVLTMTEQGSLPADILISGNRISAVAEHIPADAAGGAHVLDASGLTVMPGLVDICIHTGGCEPAWLTECALHSGVTTGIVIPDEDGMCQLLTSGGLIESDVCCIDESALTDGELRQRLSAAGQQGRRVFCPIRSAEACRRVIDVGTPPGTIMAGLDGCTTMANVLADAGITADIGISQTNRSPWRMAVSLHEAGVPVAVSCCHPSAKLTLLRVCASLCVRDGMPREAALASITRTPAAALGLHNHGRIAPGCAADLVLYDGDPLLLATSHVMTIAGGCIRQRHDRY